MDIPTYQNINPDKQYGINKITFAMYLAQNKIIPPEQWYHEPTLQDDYGRTVAMILAQYKMKIPVQWICKPIIQDNYGQTTAMYIARFSQKVPDKIWQHDPKLKNNINRTVEYYLKDNNIPVPQQWKTIQDNNINNLSEQDKKYIEDYRKYYYIKSNQVITPEYQSNSEKKTVAMYIASKGIIPSEYFNHDPKLQNSYGYTVAMYLAWNKILPPKQWYHNPELKNNSGFTVAMYIASDCRQVPDCQWQHDPNIQNNYGQTVQDYLEQNHINVPDNWKWY